MQGLENDLLPLDDRYWALAELPPRIPFDVAARQALEGHRPAPGLRGALAGLEESVVDRFGPRRRDT